MTTEYKTAAENKRDNKKLNFDMDTPFMVAFVTKIGETTMRTNSNTGEQFPSMLGKYKLYQAADDRIAWIPKWFVRNKEERNKGDILVWDDFKPSYQPDTFEWLVDDYEGNTNKEDFEQAMANYGHAQQIQTQTTSKIAESPKARKEFFGNFNERELRFLLRRNGWTQIDDDVEFTKEENPDKSTKEILLSLCRSRNVVPVNECNQDVAETLDPILRVIDDRLEVLERKLDDFTLNGTLTLKDLLSKSKLAKIEEELENAERD